MGYVDISSVTSSISELRRSVDRMSSRISDLEDHISSITGSVDDLRKRIDEIIKRQKSLESSLSSLSKTLSDKIDETSSEVVGEVREWGDSLQKGIVSVRDDVQRTNSAVSTVRKEVADVRKQQEDAYNFLKELSGRILNALKMLQGGLESADDKLKDLKSEAEGLKKSLGDLGGILQDYIDKKSKDQIKAMEKGFADVQDGLRVVESSLNDSKEEISGKLDVSHRELLGRLEGLLREIDALYMNLRDLAALLEDVRLELSNDLDVLAYSVDFCKEALSLKIVEGVV